MLCGEVGSKLGDAQRGSCQSFNRLVDGQDYTGLFYYFLSDRDQIYSDGPAPLRQRLGLYALSASIAFSRAADRLSGKSMTAGPLRFRLVKNTYGESAVSMHFSGGTSDIRTVPDHLGEMQGILLDKIELWRADGLELPTSMVARTHGRLARPAARMLGADIRELTDVEVSYALRREKLAHASADCALRGMSMPSPDAPIYEIHMSVDDFLGRDYSSVFKAPDKAD